MIRIDGSRGEGGGQVLRSSLSLSVATGEPFRIDGIRAGRERPGLLRQHLACVRAAAAVSEAEVSGAELGSTTLEFRPRGLRAGEHAFAVGSAGSALLVLQTVLPPLLLADAPSSLALEGGTHNPWAPPFDFVEHAFLPLLSRAGASVSATLERPGFHPAGGGVARFEVEPARAARPLELVERGAEREHLAEIVSAHLPERVAQDEWRAVRGVLGWSDDRLRLRRADDSAGPGNVVLLRLAFEHATEVVAGFGRKGLAARRVGRAAAREAERFLRADVPVGEHLADQLMLPLALLAGGTFRTVAPSQHARTNADVLALFLGETVRLQEEPGGTWRVDVGARLTARG